MSDRSGVDGVMANTIGPSSATEDDQERRRDNEEQDNQRGASMDSSVDQGRTEPPTRAR